MKVLISNAVWGEGYCRIFTQYSLASLLAPTNIPRLAQTADLIYHIITTRADRRRLIHDPAILLLQQYCTVEWETMEDYGIARPPQGAGGEKYPFLSALQNIAIARAADQDAIIFNYADLIWTDGSLNTSVRLLLDGEKPFDAVLTFCLPVDRDDAIVALDQHRSKSDPCSIALPPRAGATIAIECMHREAKRRLWDDPMFTVTPSYLMWPVEDQGLLIRAYHQTILALRVRDEDADFSAGIVRGSLDASFTAQLAKKKGKLIFATDSDEVLVFSLYHTPVDSRLQPGQSRESSIRELLSGVVTPEQRPFAEHAIQLRQRDCNGAAWARVAETSMEALKRLEATSPFEQSAYDRNYNAHGSIPKLSRGQGWGGHAGQQWKLCSDCLDAGLRRADWYARKFLAAFPHLKKFAVAIRNPSRLASSSERIVTLWLAWSFRQARRLLFLSVHPNLWLAMIARPIYVAPGVTIDRETRAAFTAAIEIEALVATVDDDAALIEQIRGAEAKLREVIKRAPRWIDPLRALGRNLWFQGQFADSIQMFVIAEQVRDQAARQAGYDLDACVFLPRNCAESIGLMGHIEAFVKYKILTGDRRPYYLIAPPEKIVNPAFLDYWREHLSIVSRRSDIARLSSLEKVYGVNWNWIMPKGGQTVFCHAGMAAVHRAWKEKGHEPLLRLSREHAEVLANARIAWGMEEGDRFVCLHVRSPGFYGSEREAAQQFRNTSLDPYYPVIRNLTNLGLWVVRMGDSAMPSLDLSQCGFSSRVIDYALSPRKSAEMDVALCAQCELFVSSPSGLHTVAHAFGRPVCEVNYPIYHGFPWHPGDIFAPQLYFSHDKNRALGLDEILATDILHCDHQFLLKQAGISLVPNEPDDIIETVNEALSPAAYRVNDPAAADRVGATFDMLNRKFDRDISGRLGQYFAAKHASSLMPHKDSTAPQEPPTAPPKNRKLDFLLSVYNRPNYLYHILKTGLALEIPGAYFVVFDDASDLVEEVAGLGPASVTDVCSSFNDSRVIYVRNAINLGVAKSLARYYREMADADYTSLLNPKDEFISSAPIIEAIAKLDADPRISFVVYPLRQIDRDEADKPLLFDYQRMSGRDFVAAHVRDSNLQHCSGYALMRVSAAHKVGMPRDLDLRAYGLEDASGIDHDMLFTLATTGDVDFVSKPPIRRSIVDGYTERFPLTFAYTQYQYGRRLMKELEPVGFITAETRRRYISFWHLIIARGLVVAYRHVHGSEQEQGVKRISPHLKVPILLYLPLECLRFRVLPLREAVETYLVGARLLLTAWLRKIVERPHLR
jgi:putative glycosyltransferase (TIGR04372 family)